MKTDTESKRCKSCTHQGEKAMTGKCFTCYDYENYEGSGDNEIRNPLVFDGCFTCYDRETCPDAFFGKARMCNNYGKCEQG